LLRDGDVLIERARHGDAGPLARVYVETWRTTYAGILPDRVLVNMQPAVHEVRFARWIGQQSERHFILVGRAPDDRVIALCSAGHARGQPRTMGEIYTLYVDQDWQGQGIGKVLLRSALRGLWQGGFGRALLWVLRDNPSRFFYEAEGGVRAAERTERLWGADVQEVSYLWRDLRDI